MGSSGIAAKKIEISGVVQGVGFRPFLFGLACAHHLCGHVSNTASGVAVFIQGKPENLDAFLLDILEKKTAVVTDFTHGFNGYATIGPGGFHDY